MMERRPLWAWILAALLTGFYMVLYFTDAFTPVAKALLGEGRDKWFLYGVLYTLAVLIGGIIFIYRNRSSRYQVIRTSSLIFFQVVFAFSIPLILKFFDHPEFYFSYLWPLKIEYLYPDVIGQFPVYIIAYSVLGSLVLVPVLSYFYGKRFYCSWVCGCGGLAETAGDPFRELSNKSSRAWRFEKVSIHTVLVLSIMLTLLAVTSALVGTDHPELRSLTYRFRHYYGLVVSAVLAGVVGVGLYPLMGSRVWCRFFCPMAALLGLIQKLGRFRITAQPDLCISCGNCSRFCEMGIDVKVYAREGETFTRASCVGCGMCAHVCPRGVLKLESSGNR